MLTCPNPLDSFNFMKHTLPSPIRTEVLTIQGLHHGFFTRQGGVSTGLYGSLNGGLGSDDSADNVHENRRRMAEALGASPERFLSLYQIHSADVVTVTTPWPVHDRPKADAMVTQVEGVTLAIATADCGPVLFADMTAGVIGAAHAGWKGAFTGVLEATIEAMEKLGAKREHIAAVLGPTISQKAYEVGPEFKAQFLAADRDHEAFFTPGERPDKSLFDLPAFITHRMKEAGVATFLDLALCTYSDEARFFSYRRTTHRGEKDYGRLISAISLGRE